MEEHESFSFPYFSFSSPHRFQLVFYLVSTELSRPNNGLNG
jgi:hypothetical protein